MRSQLATSAILILATSISSTAMAQIETATYELDDVWLLPDLSHPWEEARQMTGTFEWVYELNDFENGTGTFSDITIPWYWSNLSELNITFDTTSIEFTFNGNLHDRGLDITLFLLNPLSPDQPAIIDTVRSQFQVEVGIAHQGHVVSGSVFPVTQVCPADLNNDGTLNFFDVSAFLSFFGSGDLAADFTDDGTLNFFDVSAFLTSFGSGCP